MKIAINGFGRIGKCFLRAAIEQGAFGKDFELVAVNSRSPVESHVHLFRHDSAYGKFKGEAKAENGNLVVNGKTIKWVSESDPANLPWKELGIDLVIESSGKFRTREDVQKHLDAGAKYVLITAPGTDVDATIVPGVNDELITKDRQIYSLASCTTNCLAPIIKVIEDKFGIESGYLSTIHAYTADQNIVDGSHKDLRRARAAAANIVPTKTGAAKSIGEVIPAMKGKMDGVAFRVPILVGSINDISLVLKKEASAKEINEELRKASENELKGILEYTEEPIVSSDIVGDSHSGIVDGLLTKANGKLVKISAWYDNEYGYSNRIVDFIKKL